MNTAIKSAIATCGFLATASIPLTAGADTFIFSGKGVFGEMYGENGNVYMDVSAFQSATSSKSTKTNSSGAYFYGYSYTGTECWEGYGSTDTIQFNATGSLPNRVTASGVIPVTWYEYCSSYTSFTETVSFTMDLSAIRNQASKSWGTTHSEYGTIKVNTHYDDSSAPAAPNASSLSSPTFGIMTPSFGYVGQSKGHEVDIIR